MEDFRRETCEPRAVGAASRLSGPMPLPRHSSRLWLNPEPLSPGTARSGPGVQLDRTTPGLHIPLDGGAQGRAEQRSVSCG